MRRISSHGACLLDPGELTRTRGGAAHHVVGAVGAGLPAGLKKKELMRTVRSLLKQLSESEREEICLFFWSRQFQIRMNSFYFPWSSPLPKARVPEGAERGGRPQSLRGRRMGRSSPPFSPKSPNTHTNSAESDDRQLCIYSFHQLFFTPPKRPSAIWFN